MDITKVFKRVQETAAVHPKCTKELLEIYKQAKPEEFKKDFIHRLIQAFKVDLKTFNQYLDRLLDFCVKFIILIENKRNEENNVEFYDYIIDIIFKCFSVDSHNIRYHSCDFIYKYITQCENKLNNDFLKLLLDAMLIRLEDIQPLIRIKAAKILKILQDEDDPSDTIKIKFIENLGDSNAKVRATIVEGLGTTVDSIPYIIGRCRDTDTSVRITSYRKLSKIPVQRLSIEQRRYILNNGLKDHKKIVRDCVIEILLPEWLKCYDNNYLKLLTALQLDSTEKEINDTLNIINLAFDSLFESREPQEILEVLYLENKLIPLDQLTWEGTIYWNLLISYVKNKQLEDYLEQLIPETVCFCEYIHKFCSTSSLKKGSIWEQQLYLLILHQLISITVNCDISDEMSRQSLNRILVKILKESKLSEDTIQIIMKYFEKVMPNAEIRINFICEIIADIRTPLIAKFNQMELNELDTELRDLKNKLKSLQQQQRVAIEEEEFMLCQEIDNQMTEIQANIEKINKKLDEKPERLEKIMDPVTIDKCLDIIYAMFQSPQINKLYNPILLLKDEIFTEMMVIHEPVLQAKYFKCYGLICTLDKTLSKENIQLFCKALMLHNNGNDCSKEVLIAVINCIVDILILYGTDILSSDMNLDEVNNSSVDFDILFGNIESLNDVIEAICLMLNDENQELRECSCEALTKLLLLKIIASPTLVSQLIVKWLNPATESDVRSRQILGIFIENFCQLPGVENQLEEAFIPTLQTIYLAPKTSPLANLSHKDILKNLIRILNLRYDEYYPIHENLAMLLCNEIQKDINNVKNMNEHYSRALIWLELRRDNQVLIEELLSLSEDIRIDSRNKIVIKHLDKFIYSLKYETA